MLSKGFRLLNNSWRIAYPVTIYYIKVDKYFLESGIVFHSKRSFEKVERFTDFVLTYVTFRRASSWFLNCYSGSIWVWKIFGESLTDKFSNLNLFTLTIQISGRGYQKFLYVTRTLSCFAGYLNSHYFNEFERILRLCKILVSLNRIT